MYIQSVNIGYVIDYIVKERESLNGADSTIQKSSTCDGMLKPANYPWQLEQAMNIPIRHKRKSVNYC